MMSSKRHLKCRRESIQKFKLDNFYQIERFDYAVCCLLYTYEFDKIVEWASY